MTTTKSVLNNLNPFNAHDARTTERGTKLYWAVTWLDSEGASGRYEIEKVHSSLYVITHYQVIQGGKGKLVRRIGQATTKGVAMRYADIDSHNLADNVLAGLLKGGTVVIDREEKADA